MLRNIAAVPLLKKPLFSVTIIAAAASFYIPLFLVRSTAAVPLLKKTIVFGNSYGSSS